MRIPGRVTWLGRLAGRSDVWLLASAFVCLLGAAPTTADPWVGDLDPLPESEWNRARAAHLLERAGFGGTPEEIDALHRRGVAGAVAHLVEFHDVPNGHLEPFVHSGVHDPSLEPFPPSRPAATRLARKQGHAMGVRVKPAGNRPLQPVVDRFFYWLRATYLETHRVAYWWANRMLTTNRPLEEKLALFWHGHFAVNETKIRDYRKMLKQLELFHRLGAGSFRELAIGVAQDPAMLAFLDAGVNVKGSPNENFAREIMELFTMGVGNYSEADVREAARAFTGWNYRDLEFVVNVDQHDADEKRVLGRQGSFDGVEVIDIILDQPATASFVGAKLYRYFVRQELSPELEARVGDAYRESGYDTGALLSLLFRSKDFYSSATVGNQIKSPVQLVISTYKKLGLEEVPGIPDFNDVTAELGQQLLRPPTVAGWAHGRAWITPGLLMARGNFGYDVVFPDINFVPHDRLPRDTKIREVHERIAQGFDISSATVPEEAEGGMMAMSNAMADRDEDFNTRYGSYRGWQKAIERVRPIPRNAAHLDLTALVRAGGARSAPEAVDLLLARFLSVPVDPAFRSGLVRFLESELGTEDLERAESYLETPLRGVLHLILSAPEYQLS